LVQRRAAAARFQAEAGVEATAASFEVASSFQAEAGVVATAASFEVASSFEAGVAGVEEPGAAAEVKDEAAGAVDLSVLLGRGE
jgi:hypothetical protein